MVSFKKLFKCQKGELTLFTMSFIFPLLFILGMFVFNFGIGAHAKNTTTTAAREAARSYAIIHNKDAAKEVAIDIISNSLPTRKDCFNESQDVELTEIEQNGQDYCKAKVTYRVPIFTPNLPRLLNSNFKGWGEYIEVPSMAIFNKEAEPEVIADE